MHLIFTGDISLYKRTTDPFQKVKSAFKKADFVIGNFESPVLENQNNNTSNLFCKSSSVKFLSTIKLTHASLANNHVFDGGINSISNTINELDKQKINYFGANNTSKDNSIIRIIKNNISISLINCVSEDTNPSLPSNSSFLSLINEKKLKLQINKEKEYSDYVLILLHWGGKIEGGSFPEKKQVKLAHNLINEGADLIIGNHSHTIQPYEIYKGKHIYYSLGDFVNNTVYQKGPMGKKRRKGLLIHMDISKEYMHYNYQYISKCNGTPFLINNYYKKFILKTKLYHIFKYIPGWFILYLIYLNILEPFLNFTFYSNLTYKERLKVILSKSVNKIVVKTKKLIS